MFFNFRNNSDVGSKVSSSDTVKTSGGVTLKSKKKPREFKQLCNDDVIQDISCKTYATESEKKIRWAIKMCNDWRNSHIESPNALN